MKQPKLVTVKMPVPSSREIEAGKKVLATFAHHAPSIVKPIERMERPGKPHGPRN